MGERELKGALEHIHRRLLEEGERVVVFFKTLTQDQLESIIYPDGPRWNTRQVLSHLVATEKAYQHHLEQLLKSGDQLLFDKDIDEFNQAEVRKLEGIPVQELLESFRQARQRTLHLVETMHDRDLSLTAVHPWFGEQQIGWLLKLIYRHNAMHLKDVRSHLLSPASPSGTSEG